jgi:hypothetical protein
MKRTELRRTVALKRSGDLSRTTPLKESRTPLKPGSRRETNLVLAREFYTRVTKAPSGLRHPCIICDAIPAGRSQAHHCIPKQWIKRELAFLPVEEQETWVWDHRNGVCMCAADHERQESGARRIPREWLPQAVWDFAYDLDQLLETEAATQKLVDIYPLVVHEDA